MPYIRHVHLTRTVRAHCRVTAGIMLKGKIIGLKYCDVMLENAAGGARRRFVFDDSPRECDRGRFRVVAETESRVSLSSLFEGRLKSEKKRRYESTHERQLRCREKTGSGCHTFEILMVKRVKKICVQYFLILRTFSYRCNL